MSNSEADLIDEKAEEIAYQIAEEQGHWVNVYRKSMSGITHIHPPDPEAEGLESLCKDEQYNYGMDAEARKKDFSVIPRGYYKVCGTCKRVIKDRRDL